MKPLLVAILLAFTSACFGGGNGLPEPASPAGASVKRIRGTGMFISTPRWAATPWARIEDAVIELPVLVLIAEDNSACIVDGKLWASAQAGAFYECPGKWRWPRVQPRVPR
jgi:hypothetical protein